MKALRATLALAIVVLSGLAFAAGPASAAFGIASYRTSFQTPSSESLPTGVEVTQAGSHADMVTELDFNLAPPDPNGKVFMEGQARDIEADLPAGFYGNPQALPTCALATVIAKDGFCDPGAQVGILNYEIPNSNGFFADFPVYNLEAPDEQTAVLGVVAVSVPVKIVVSVRTDGDYGLTARLSNLNQGLALTHTRLTLWGVPADPIHDPNRLSGLFAGGLSAGVPERPFLSMPARCEPVTTRLRADSWQNPGQWVEAPPVVTSTLTGCDALKFSGKLTAHPQETVAGVPSGLDVDLTIPQDESALGLATPQLRSTSVTFPKGVSIAPGSASGLGACSDGDLKLGSKAEPTCPDSSKLGTVEIETPVLAKPLLGEMVLRTPQPGELFRLAIIARGPDFVIKLPGVARPDRSTGQLTVTFDNTPQLPFENLHLELKGGPRAALSLPTQCGTYTTHAELGNWTNSKVVSNDSSFTISSGCEKAGQFSPELEAGTTNPVAGRFSPFIFRVIGQDGQQNLSRIEATLPRGVLAKLAGVPLCGDGDAASGNCPAGSQVGTTTVGAGPGSMPIYVPQPGKDPTAVYLAGPYRGAPYSLVVKVPAQAGPFDLGTVAVRNALYVDPASTQVTVKSDPLPQILEGVPIAYRDIRVEVNRSDFTVNPTSCEPMKVTSTLTSISGTVAHPSDRFQASGCGELAFKPKLAISLKGKMKRSGNPALTATLTAAPGQANIGSTSVVLPKSQFIDNSHINNPCTRVQFSEGKCPPKSILGTATAYTPLLDKPLTGPVYFRSNGGERELPDLFVDLHGPIDVSLVGFIDSVGPKNAEVRPVRTRFLSVPDAPVSKFILKLDGGKKGLLENSANLCKAPQLAKVRMAGQNGKPNNFTQRIQTSCGKKAKRKGS